MIILPQSAITPGGGNTGGGVVTLPPPRQTASFDLTLTGADGSVWDLVSGPVKLLTGVQAFEAPTVAHWSQVSPGRNGSRWDGMRTPESAEILALGVIGDDWASWRATDSALFRALHPSGEVTFTVTGPDGRGRSKRMRFVDGGGIEGMDPLSVLYAAYALEFTAANPFWFADDVVVAFDPRDPQPFLVPPGPPIFLNAPSISGGAQVPNPGDEYVWPRYTITGPSTRWQVGIGDGLVSSTTPLAAGRQIFIDMSRNLVVDDTGTDVYGILDDDTFQQLPPGLEVPVELEMDGYSDASLIEVALTPLYRRPW